MSLVGKGRGMSHLDVAEGSHVVGPWGQVHSQLGLIGSLPLVGCLHLQL